MPVPKDVVTFLLANGSRAEELQDTDLTVKRAADIWGIGARAARERLEKMVKEGKMEQAKKVDTSLSNRRRVTVYVKR